ncbi:calcium-binding protein [Rhizobium setariae]|nr:calcium-binding protein [Rhizobium setariae]
MTKRNLNSAPDIGDLPLAQSTAFGGAINPKNFTTTIDNPYMILKEGTTFHYADMGLGTTTNTMVTHKTAVIDGVRCVVVHDVAFVNGQLEEDTFDYYAQDKRGNVWYFGEDTTQYEPGNPVPIGTVGSWRAGVDGAKPGIIMEARPHIGDVYHQENAKGIAEDAAKVLSLDANVFTIYGMSHHALKTKEFSPLSPGQIEHKFYIAGVGELLTTTSDGEYEQLVGISINGRAGNDSLIGYSGGDEIRGRAGNDTEHGHDGNDTLRGGDGRDSLFGGRGGDLLVGGTGNAQFAGGLGADTFSFKNLHDGVFEVTEIDDYRRQQVDVIDLPHAKGSIFGENLVHGVWQLTLNGDGDVIRLNGVTDVDHNGSIVDNLIFV